MAKKFFGRRGGNTIGYVLLAALIGVVSIGGIMGAGQQNRDNATYVACTIARVLTGASEECERGGGSTQQIVWGTSSGRIATVAVGDAVDATITATSNAGAVTFSRISGTLPPGVTLGADGHVTGTAGGSEGIYSFTVQATAGTASVTRTFEIWVGEAPAWQTSQADLPNLLIGDVLSNFFFRATDSQPVTYALRGGAFPGGLTINPVSGALAGTVSGPNGTFQATLRATDTTGLWSERTFTFTLGGCEPGVQAPFATGAEVRTDLERSEQVIFTWPAPTQLPCAPIEIGVAGEGTPEISVDNGQTWTTSAIWNGTFGLQARMLAAPTFSAAVTGLVTGGTELQTIVLVTKDQLTALLQFDTLYNRDPNALTSSDPRDFTGFVGSLPVTVSGPGNPDISIDGGATWATSATIVDGSQVMVRMLTAQGFEEERQVTVTAPDREASFTTVTRAFDPNPEAPTFTTLRNQPASTLVRSNTVELRSFDGTVTASVSGDGGPQLSVDGGVTWTTSATVQAGQLLQLRHTTGPTQGTRRTATLALGDVVARWNTDVTGNDQDPNPFTFGTARAAALVQTATAAIEVTDFDGFLPVTLTRDALVATVEMSINNGPWVTSGEIRSGQRIQLRGARLVPDAPSSYREAVVAVTIGQRTGEWRIATNPVGGLPTAFSLPTAYADPGEMFVSDAVAITGNFTGPMPIGAPGLEMSINGGAWIANSINAQNGDSVRFRAPALGGYSQFTFSSIGYGYVNNGTRPWFYWTRATYPAPTDPGNAVFQNQTAEPSTLVRTGVLIGNLASPVTFSVAAAPGSPTLRVNNGPWQQSVTVPSNALVEIRAVSGPEFGDVRNFTVNQAGTVKTWTVTTRAERTPTAVQVSDAIGVTPGDVRIANVRLPQFDGIATLSISGPEGSPTISVEGDAFFTAAPQTVTGSQNIQVRMTASSTWATTRTATINLSGTVSTWNVRTMNQPNPLIRPGFSDQLDATLGTLYLSNYATLPTVDGSGLTTITVENGQVSINDGPWSANTSVLSLSGQAVRLRATSALTYDTPTVVRLRVGTLSDASWLLVTARPSPLSPALQDLRNQKRSTTVTSNIVSLPTFQDSLPAVVSVEGGEISIEGGAFAPTAQIDALVGQSIRLRTVTPDTAETDKVVTLRIDRLPDIRWQVGTHRIYGISPGFGISEGNPSSLTASAVTRLPVIPNFAPVQAVLSSGEMSIDGGAWTAGPATIADMAGQTIQLRATTGPNFGDSRTVTLTIGDLPTATWTLNTRPISLAPVLTFPEVTVLPAATATSATVAVPTIDGQLVASVTDGQMRINGGAWSTGGQVSTGDTVQLRTTMPDDEGQQTNVRLTIGQGTSTWVVKTTPRPSVTFSAGGLGPDIGNAEPNTVYLSGTTTVSGTFTRPQAIRWTTPGGEASVNGGPWTRTATVIPGDTIRYRVTSASDFLTLVRATAGIGSATLGFSVVTRGRDTTPNTAPFVDAVDQPLDTQVTSNTIVPDGFDGTIAIALTGDATARMSINGGPLVRSGNLTAGNTLQIQMTSGPAMDDVRSVNVVTQGATFGVWRVATILRDRTPNTVTFTDVTGAEPDTLYVTGTVTVSGFQDGIPVDVTAPAGANAEVQVNANAAWATPDTIQPGQTMRVRMKSPPTFGSSWTATITVGTASIPWTITTRTTDSEPDPFVLTDLVGAPTGETVQSNVVILTGFADTFTVSAAGGFGAAVSINGQDYAASVANVAPGSTLRAKVETSANELTPHTITVTAGTRTVTWTVTTANQPPVWQSAEGQIGPTYARGEALPTNISVVATDGSNVAYEVVGAMPDGVLADGTGVITGTPTTSGLQTFSIRATDALGLSRTRLFSLRVSDRPVWAIAEIPAGQTNVPMAVQLQVTDEDDTSHSFTVSAGTLPNGLSLSSGGLLSGTPTQSGVFQISFRATDPKGLTKDAILPVRIFDVPTWTTPAGLVTTIAQGEAIPAGLRVSAALATNYGVTGGSLPAGVALNGDGTFAGTPTALGTSNFTVVAASAQAGNSAPRNFALKVGTRPAFTTAADLGTVGVTVPSSRTLQVSDADGQSSTFEQVSGSLPPGMSLNNQGVVSGTPLTGGTYSFTVTATDPDGLSTTRAFTLRASANGTWVTPAGTLGTFAPTDVVSIQLQAQDVGPSGFRVAPNASLPSWLSLSAAGQLSGVVPTGNGTFPFTLQVQGFAGTWSSREFSVSISDRPVWTTPANLGRVVRTEPASITFAATRAVTYTAGTGTFPPGLTLNPNTGVYSGTPTGVGTYVFTIRAADANGQTAEQQFTLRVDNRPVWLTAADELPNLALNEPFSYALQATDADAGQVLTYAVTAGVLPMGVTLNADTGVISGTPVTDGPVSVTVTVTDTTALSASRTFDTAVTAARSSCWAHLQAGGTTSGIYPVDIDGPGGQPALNAYCDQVSAGGGWMMVAAQFESDPVAWNEGRQADYDPSLTTNRSFALAQNELPARNETGFGIGFNAQTADWVPFTYTTGNIPLTTVTSTQTGRTYQIYRNTANYYSGNDPELALQPSNTNWNNTLTLNQTGGNFNNWAFSPNHTTVAARGYANNADLSGSAQSYAWTVWVRWRGGTQVVQAPVWQTPADLGFAGTGRAYSNQLQANEPGGATVGYALVSGTLPTGLTLTSAGLLAGTPTTTGNWTFTIRAEVAGFSADRTFTLYTDIPLDWTTSAGVLPGPFYTGQPASLTFQSVGPGTRSYSLISGSLPAGLLLDGATGVLSGTPTQTGTFAFTVRLATTTAGVTAIDRSFSMLVEQLVDGFLEVRGSTSTVLTGTYVVPAGVTSITVQGVSGGGNGAGNQGLSGAGGGGGGAFNVAGFPITVTPGETLNYSVGSRAGNVTLTRGGTTLFSLGAGVTATTGTGGAGGTAGIYGVNGTVGGNGAARFTAGTATTGINGGGGGGGCGDNSPYVNGQAGGAGASAVAWGGTAGGTGGTPGMTGGTNSLATGGTGGNVQTANGGGGGAGGGLFGGFGAGGGGAGGGCFGGPTAGLGAPGYLRIFPGTATTPTGAASPTIAWNTNATIDVMVSSTVSTQLSATRSDGATVSYAIVSGTLPAGLSMNANGLITGTAPSTATSSVFTVAAITTATPASCPTAPCPGMVSNRTFTMNILSPPVWVTATNALSVLSLYTSPAFSFSANEATSYEVVAGSLPSGTTMSTAGALSGIYTPGGSGSVTIRAVNGVGTVDRTFDWSILGQTIFTFNGTAQNNGTTQAFVVPAGVTSLNVKMWGGGGGGGTGNSMHGGGGGYVGGTLAVTPGDTLTIWVAGGGQGSDFGRAAGAGGGASAIRLNSTVVLVAGGGGGGIGLSGTNRNGGAGGGTTGERISCGGNGGTQTAAGTGTSCGRRTGGSGSGSNGGGGGTGSLYSVGGWGFGLGGQGDRNNEDAGSGGGGGGFFGGGQGGGDVSGFGGGGGSSYTHPSLVTGASNLGGTGPTPGNTADTDRAGAGAGGNTTTATRALAAGGNGRVIIRY